MADEIISNDELSNPIENATQRTTTMVAEPYKETSTIVLLILSFIGGQFIPTILAIVSLIKGLKGADTIKANKLTKIGWILYIVGIVLTIFLCVAYFALFANMAKNGMLDTAEMASYGM